MHDEFRIRVEVPRERVGELLSSLEGRERGGDGGLPSPGRVAVSHEDGHVFLYADCGEDAARARSAVEAVLSEHGIDGTLSAWRWHPQEDRWEDASLPLPATDSERAAEHAHLEELESEESQLEGYPAWEVRVSLPSHHEARAFAERLQDEEIPVLRRWRHVVVGANDEDEAHELAERLRAEAPQGSTLDVEGAAWPIWVQLHNSARPFAIFGGLGQ